jgi:hypothetical protein
MLHDVFVGPCTLRAHLSIAFSSLDWVSCWTTGTLSPPALWSFVGVGHLLTTCLRPVILFPRLWAPIPRSICGQTRTNHCNVYRTSQHKVSNARPASKRFKLPLDARLLRSMPATNTARLTKIALLELRELRELRLFDDSQMSSEG